MEHPPPKRQRLRRKTDTQHDASTWLGPTLILLGLDALMPQTVVENAFAGVLAITAAVPRAAATIHIRVQVRCNARLNLPLALPLRQADARRGDLLRTKSRPTDRAAPIPAASGPFGLSDHK